MGRQIPESGMGRDHHLYGKGRESGTIITVTSMLYYTSETSSGMKGISHNKYLFSFQFISHDI